VFLGRQRIDEHWTELRRQVCPHRNVTDRAVGPASTWTRSPGWCTGRWSSPSPRSVGHGPRLLEVLEGARRPSADFFHTRNSTCASPSAVFSASTSAASASPDCSTSTTRRAASPARPPSRNCCRHFPTEVSETFVPPRRLRDRQLTGQALAGVEVLGHDVQL
jgi:hypothetical protein